MESSSIRPTFERKKYPLVLYIHGGPTASSTTQFSFLPQLLATNGYVSSHRTIAAAITSATLYQRAIWNDAGDGPGRDVMSGIDALKQGNFIDDSKIGVTGWSYGGYMTSWLIGHYEIWKVALAGAPVIDLYRRI